MRRAWLVAALVAAGCEGESRLEIRDRRAPTGEPRRVSVASAEERFRVAELFDQQQGLAAGAPGAAGDHDHAPGEPHLTFDLPQGWERLPRTDLRLINLRAGDASCWVTFLAGGGGGLLANVNRWRDQLGAAPVDAAGLAALPRVEVLGRPAVWFDLEGQSEQGPARFLGLLLELESGLLTIKLAAAPAAAEANREPLLRFAASLREGH